MVTELSNLITQKNMSGVDLADQFITNYNSQRKSNKWWRTLFFHIFNMTILNAFILNKKYGSVKLSHSEFQENITNHLITESLKEYTLQPQPLKSKAQKNMLHPEHLLGRHFPSHIEGNNFQLKKASSQDMCCV